MELAEVCKLGPAHEALQRGASNNYPSLRNAYSALRILVRAADRRLTDLKFQELLLGPNAAVAMNAQRSRIFRQFVLEPADQYSQATLQVLRQAHSTTKSQLLGYLILSHDAKSNARPMDEEDVLTWICHIQDWPAEEKLKAESILRSWLPQVHRVGQQLYIRGDHSLELLRPDPIGQLLRKGDLAFTDRDSWQFQCLRNLGLNLGEGCPNPWDGLELPLDAPTQGPDLAISLLLQAPKERCNLRLIDLFISSFEGKSTAPPELGDFTCSAFSQVHLAGKLTPITLAACCRLYCYHGCDDKGAKLLVRLISEQDFGSLWPQVQNFVYEFVEFIDVPLVRWILRGIDDMPIEDAAVVYTKILRASTPAEVRCEVAVHNPNRLLDALEAGHLIPYAFEWMRSDLAGHENRIAELSGRYVTLPCEPPVEIPSFFLLPQMERHTDIDPSELPHEACLDLRDYLMTEGQTLQDLCIRRIAALHKVMNQTRLVLLAENLIHKIKLGRQKLLTPHPELDPDELAACLDNSPHDLGRCLLKAFIQNSEVTPALARALRTVAPHATQQGVRKLQQLLEASIFIAGVDWNPQTLCFLLQAASLLKLHYLQTEIVSFLKRKATDITQGSRVFPAKHDWSPVLELLEPHIRNDVELSFTRALIGGIGSIATASRIPPSMLLSDSLYGRLLRSALSGYSLAGLDNTPWSELYLAMNLHSAIMDALQQDEVPLVIELKASDTITCIPSPSYNCLLQESLINAEARTTENDWACMLGLFATVTLRRRPLSDHDELLNLRFMKLMQQGLKAEALDLRSCQSILHCHLVSNALITIPLEDDFEIKVRDREQPVAVSSLLFNCAFPESKGQAPEDWTYAEATALSNWLYRGSMPRDKDSRAKLISLSKEADTGTELEHRAKFISPYTGRPFPPSDQSVYGAL